MSGDNNPKLGKTDTNPPNFEKSHSAETKTLMNQAMTGENNPNFSKTHFAKT